MDNSSIKENIVRRRTAEGISQDEMAKRLDISRNAYRSIEKGESKVISDRLKDIATILAFLWRNWCSDTIPETGRANSMK